MKLIHSTMLFAAVLVFFVLGGMTQTNAQTKYRTFSQQSLSEKKGHPGKSLGSKVCFNFVNDELFGRYGVKAIISAPIMAVLDSGGFTTITIDSKQRIIHAFGNTLIPSGGSASLCLLVQKKNAGTQADYWWWTNSTGDPVTVQANMKLAAASDAQLFTQPNGGNARDFIYKKVVAKPAGVVMGIPRPDSAKYYGWIRYKVSDRYDFPHTGYARCFDFIQSANGSTHPFVKELKNPHVAKHDNHLLGEAHALKLAVIANDAHVTEPFDLVSTRLGDLIYNNPIDPADALNGMTIRQLLLKADSMLTFCGKYGPDEFMHGDTAISRINRAFDGAYYAVSFDPFQLAGTHSLGEVPWLLPNPTASPVGINQVNATIIDDVPVGFELRQNYPNPFNPTTTIEFNLGDDPAIVTLKIYNMLGQEVATLYDQQQLDGGEQTATFDANNVPSGVYIYKIYAQGLGDDAKFFQDSRKMVLMK